eukprot:1374733-Rhodomonas_salina.1
MRVLDWWCLTCRDPLARQLDSDTLHAHTSSSSWSGSQASGSLVPLSAAALRRWPEADPPHAHRLRARARSTHTHTQHPPPRSLTPHRPHEPRGTVTHPAERRVRAAASGEGVPGGGSEAAHGAGLVDGAVLPGAARASARALAAP